MVQRIGGLCHGTLFKDLTGVRHMSSEEAHLKLNHERTRLKMALNQDRMATPLAEGVVICDLHRPGGELNSASMMLTAKNRGCQLCALLLGAILEIRPDWPTEESRTHWVRFLGNSNWGHDVQLQEVHGEGSTYTEFQLKARLPGRYLPASLGLLPLLSI